MRRRDLLKDEETILLLSGDHPLITSDLLTQLLRAHEEQGAQATMLTTDTLDPTAYGRIVRDKKGRVEQIIETKDETKVSPEHLAIPEINLGTYVFDGPALFDALEQGRAGGERRAIPDGGLPAPRRASPPSPRTTSRAPPA